MTQVFPLQQSVVAVQICPVPWHTTGVPHVPFMQICEQQSAENEHPMPFARHSPASLTPASIVVPPSVVVPASPGVSSNGRHTPPMQNAPPQQLASFTHVA